MGLDASLRRAIDQRESQGASVPDSTPSKDDNPQLVMSAGVVRPVYKFEDGDGLTDAFGNVYEGYGGSGGSSFSYRHIPAESVDQEIDVESQDGDIPVFNGQREKYEAKQPEEINLRRFQEATIDGQIPVWDNTQNIYVPKEPTQSGLAQALTSDFISIYVNFPEDKSYKVLHNIPYAMTITSFSFDFEVGTGTVSIPLGTVNAGGSLALTLSGLSGDARGLTVTVNFDYDQNEATP